MVRRFAMAAATLAAVFLLPVEGRAAGASPSAGASEVDGSRRALDRDRKPEKPERPKRRLIVPELDPTAAGAIVAIIAGGALLVARRRRQE